MFFMGNHTHLFIYLGLTKDIIAKLVLGEICILFYTPVWKTGHILVVPMACGLSGAYFLHARNNFKQTSSKCLQLWEAVLCTGNRSLGQSSRSLRGRWKKSVLSKTSTFMEGFQYNLAHMFTIVRRSVARNV
jgi:hypothetical protein